jgi:hypothetical protein
MHDGWIDFTTPRGRSLPWTALLLALALGVAAAAAVGCVKDLPECSDGTEPDQLKCDVGAEADAKPPPSCVPGSGDPSADCGIFVSISGGDDGNAGSPEAPVKTLKKALDLAQAHGTPVYVCGEEFPVTGSLEVPAGTVIYGSLDCKNGWAFPAAGDAPSTVVRGSKSGVTPLWLKAGGGNTEVSGLRVIARDGLAPDGSSIAVLVEDVRAIFSNCTLEAGDGADGAKGAASSPAPGQSGAPGDAGGLACTSTDVPGGLGGFTDCSGAQTEGGLGGTGGQFVGGVGKPGKPVSAQSGLGGAGQAAMDCQPGGAGKDGDQGAAGADAVGTGTLSALGYAGLPGADGAIGKAGQGGGGGGGSKGGTGAGKCSDAVNGGSSGGGGGAGGCGGAGGRGGSPGGASIAIASLGAAAENRLVLSQVKLVVGSGGKGGAGAEGQEGGPGGIGGQGGTPPMGASLLKPGCAGGSGGKGGRGGLGGAGLAGPSVGVAFTGEPPGKANLVFESAAGELGLEQKMFSNP